ncbi:hypothetical protein TWF696_009143 [Orbilia brochopaga]|uniref:Uncharacterized protein n=1 Tax=Orbilia brochopaga TaxID=3140254 RepID=A0AAV9UFV4_9PEZI
MAWRTLIAVLPALSEALAISEYSNVGRRESHLSRRESGVNAMCWWELPSSAIIRDQLYVNGGVLTTGNISIDGTLQGGRPNDNNSPTKTYVLNLGTGFNTSDIPFQTIDTPFTQVTNGFMAANDNSFWLYGGLIYESDSILAYPDANEVEVYDVYMQGPVRYWNQGWQNGRALSNGVTRYVAGGAGVNVRELNQTFYFSGARGEDWGEIRGPGVVRPQHNANVTSQQFITADLSDQARTSWTNTTLPSTVRPRVNGEIVYVPAGKLGALIVLGGVTTADWQPRSRGTQGSDAIQTAISTGPSFLSRVEVYDLSAKQWYIQNTTGEMPPTGLAEFCATVATSQDGNSHQIYVYGGYPGNGVTTPLPVYDSVYVLSIPAFHWIKISTGSTLLGRRGHKCVKPLPDQMFIIGGHPPGDSQCIDIIRIFNLNTLEFSTEYKPATYEDYKVPSAIRNVIGGDETGGATRTASRWAAPTLEKMFVSERPPTKATTWYPYSAAPATGTPSISIIQTKSETPKFVYPVVAVCVVLVLAIIGGLIAWFCIRRRRQQRAAKAAGNEQFQNSEKDSKLAGAYQQYPADPPHGYNSYGSVSTVAPAYSQHAHDGTPQIFFELPAEPRGPAELDSGAEYTKLGVIAENHNQNDVLSIVPTPATEHSDPLGTRQTRRSVFSEESTAPVDTDGVSPLTPDPEIAGNSGDPTGSGAAQFSWWRRQSMRGSAVARKISDISFRSLSRSSTGLSRSESLMSPAAAPVPAGNGSSVAPATNVSITPPSRGSQNEPSKGSQHEPSNKSTESMPIPPPTNTN